MRKRVQVAEQLSWHHELPAEVQDLFRHIARIMSEEERHYDQVEAHFAAWVDRYYGEIFKDTRTETVGA
jgi:hypothetical protein